MNPLQSISSVFRNYINFSGRAQRSEFWWFALFSVVSQAVLNIVPILGWIYSLILLLPSLAVTARRLHDTGRSALWLLIYLVIILGWIVGMIMIFLFFASIDDDDEIQDRLESKLEQRLSESEVRHIVNTCGELDDVELSETEREEWDEICDVIYGGFWDSLIFLLIWGLVSAAGVITILILCAFPGTIGPNRYGPDPLRPDGGMGGYGEPGDPYAQSPEASYVERTYVTSPMPDGGERLYCSQCGAERQPDAQFCTACGAAV